MSTLPWSMTRLDAVADIVTGSTPATSDRSNYGQEYMFVSPADIGKGKFVRSTIKNLSEVGYSRTRHVPKGSVLFVCIGSTIGKVGIAGDDLATNQQINALIPSHAVDSDFLFYAASTLSGIVRNQAGEQAVPLVSKAQFSRFEIPTPPLVEQKRIASTISDADRLIESLERLISKKQAIKQGMMQELLSGKTRLPGFHSPWVTYSFGHLLSYEQPGPYLVGSAEYSQFGIPVLTAGKTFVLGYTRENDGIYAELPVIIFDDFTTATQYVDFPFKAKSSAMKILTAKPGVDIRWVFEKMQNVKFNAVDHKRRWITEYSKIEIPTPSLEEQRAIAEVIRDADDEIRTLQSRLESARNIKQGVMQELLSGRTRLPIEEVSS